MFGFKKKKEIVNIDFKNRNWLDERVNTIIDKLHKKTEVRVTIEVHDEKEEVWIKIKPIPEAGNDIVIFPFKDITNRNYMDHLYNKLYGYLSV
jgi:hypothetical protein